MIEMINIEAGWQGTRKLDRVIASRNGYSLLEMLLAVSLMTILIAAVTFTTGFFVQLSSKGRIQVEQAFTVDCVIEDLILDIKATSRDISPLNTSDLARASNPLAPEMAVGSERMLQWESSQENRYVNLVGNSGALMITRDGVNPRFTGQSKDAQLSNPTDSQQHILWMAPSIQQSTLAAEISGLQCINRTFARPNGSSGLIRAHVRRNLLLASMETNEVVATQFRYWDGKTWVESWNSFERKNQLPSAIEITVRLRTDPDKRQRFICGLEQQSYLRSPKATDFIDGLQP